jgi:hypothetical protein
MKHVIKFVSDLQQVSGFLRVRYNWNIVESGVKHQTQKLLLVYRWKLNCVSILQTCEYYSKYKHKVHQYYKDIYCLNKSQNINLLNIV